MYDPNEFFSAERKPNKDVTDINVGNKSAEDINVLTNADRIRAMSDEELAEFLGSRDVAICDFIFAHLTRVTGMKFAEKFKPDLSAIKSGTLELLKSPAEGDL